MSPDNRFAAVSFAY